MAFAINATTIKLRFPEFIAEADATVEFAIEEANGEIDPTQYVQLGDVNKAFEYLAAHYLMCAIQRRTSGTGQIVSSERVGDFTFSYERTDQATKTDSSDFSSTYYGSRFQKLAKLNMAGARII